jgi:transposase
MGKRVYSDEFKRAAIEQVVVQRHTMSSVAKRLGVNYHTLRSWVQDAKAASATSTVPAGLPPEVRVRELEKENARLRMERDILKKATAYFAALDAKEGRP